jgi:hypothetical protein
MSEIVTEKANIKIHKVLDVWKKSMDLVERVYRRTERFPDSEKYGLTNQMMLFHLNSSPISHLSSLFTHFSCLITHSSLLSNELQ